MQDDRYHICVDGKSIFRADSIKVAMNLWEIAKTYYQHGWITIERPVGAIQYIFKKNSHQISPNCNTNRHQKSHG